MLIQSRKNVTRAWEMPLLTSWASKDYPFATTFMEQTEKKDLINRLTSRDDLPGQFVLQYYTLPPKTLGISKAIALVLKISSSSLLIMSLTTILRSAVDLEMRSSVCFW